MAAMSTVLAAKAWGRNDDGQCGNGGDTVDSIGDEDGEMGDNLRALDLDRQPTRVWSGFLSLSPSRRVHRLSVFWKDADCGSFGGANGGDGQSECGALGGSDSAELGAHGVALLLRRLLQLLYVR